MRGMDILYLLIPLSLVLGLRHRRPVLVVPEERTV
jgi:hypothetical protein